MKNEKSFFKKFHRKYIFLQNSLSDFLYWRTSNFLQQKESLLITNKKFKFEKKPSLIQQDKICLQEYWKSSDNKKIKNAIQTINTKLNNSNDFENQEKKFKEISASLKESKFSFSSEQNKVELSPALEKQKTTSSVKCTALFFKKTKQKLYKNRNKTLRGNAILMLPLRQRGAKCRAERPCEQLSKPLIVQASSIFTAFSFQNITNQKFGKFFPKKKNFKQYWIFPLLGFVFLFSLPSLSLQKKAFSEKASQNKMFFEKNTNHILPSSFFGTEKIFNLSPSLLKKNTTLSSFNSVQRIMNFSYSDNFSKETYERLQKLEKNEFQLFCDFYLTFFQNSMLNFFISEKENEIVQKYLFEKSNLNFVEKNKFRILFETNRNILNWKWFSLNSPFLTFEQINKFSNFFSLEVPQKAQFCFPNFQTISNLNKNYSKNENNQKKILQLTPVLQFSKASFILNEFQKNQNIESFLTNSENIVLKNSDIKKQEFLNTNFILNVDEKDFLTNLKKEDLKFLTSVSEQKTIFKNQKNLEFNFLTSTSNNSVFEIFNQQLFEHKDLNYNSNNLFFLQKWFQTQNFWQLQKKSSNEKISEQSVNKFIKKLSLFSTDNFSLEAVDPIQTSLPFTQNIKQKFAALTSIPHITYNKVVQGSVACMCADNFMNLDSLYLQKFLESFQSKNKLFLKKKINNIIPFSNFSQFVEFTPNQPLFKTTEKNDLFVFNNNKLAMFTRDNMFKQKTIKKSDFSLKLKKQTFEFFVFEHYGKNSKNFFKQFSFNKNKVLLLCRAHVFSKLEVNKKNLEVLQKFKKTYFLNDFFMKQSLKKDLNTLENSNKITPLEIPIFLDYSNKNRLKNLFFALNKQTNENQQNYFEKSNFSYFPLKFYNQNSFENLESQSSKLSSNYFHFGNFYRIIPFFSFDLLSSQDSIQYSENKAFFNKVALFENKTDQKLFCKNSKKSIFYCSKSDFFDTIFENTIKKLKTSISTFEFFKKSFFVEKIKNKQPFVFETSGSFDSKWLPNNSASHEKVQSFFVKYSKSFVLKPFSEKQIQKNLYILSNQSKNNFKTNFKKYNKDFSDFESRKYEKLFKAFLSSVNKERNDLSFDSTINGVSSNLRKSRKLKVLSKVKTQNDLHFLQTLSNSVKTQVKSPNPIFFISSRKKKFEKTNTTIEKSLIFENQKVDLSPTQLTLVQNSTKKDSIRPTILLKRDGFISVVRKQEVNNFNKISDLKMEKFFFLKHENNKLLQTMQEDKCAPLICTRTKRITPLACVPRPIPCGTQPIPFGEGDGEGLRSFPKGLRSAGAGDPKSYGEDHTVYNYLVQIAQKDTNHLTISRLEKEKALQKKRRMKKQKLETRRRKKRKRFFPRPLWLRFHMYKKFLKIRHPDKFIDQNFNFSSKAACFSTNKENISSLQQNLNSNQTKSFKKVSFVYPKFKYQNFSNSKKLYVSYNPLFQNRWNNVFSSSFLTSKKKRFKRNLFYSQQNFKANKKLKFFGARPFSFNKLSFGTKQYSQFLKSQNQIEQMKIYHTNRQKWGFYWQNGFQEKIFYKKFPLQKSFDQKTNFFNGSEKSPISQNREHYKISGEILSEFIRLSWKSYWFQMNFQPYTRKISKNFRKMQQIESKKNFSNFTLFSIFGNLQYPSLLNGGTPMIFSNVQQYSQNDFILKKSVLKKFLWYCNIRNSLESKPIVDSELMTGTQELLNFQKIQNFPEYNRILYFRVSEILKNFKSADPLVNDENFSQTSQKPLKIPKRKIESFSHTTSNSSFFTKFAVFSENFTVPSQPSIPAFSVFSSLFNDTSIKSTGEIPTLRALWALHQTNLYHFQEKNPVRNLWTFKKRIESLKSLKATKKAIHYFRKYSGLEKFNVPTFFKSFGSNQRDQTESFVIVPVESVQMQVLQQEQKNKFSWHQSQGLTQKNAFFPEKLQTNKLLVLSTLNSEFKDFVQQLDTMCLQKFMNLQQKCAIFGIKTFEQNSKISLRYLKFHLLSKKPLETIFQEKFVSPFDKTKPNPLNSAKSSLNFWWSQKTRNSFEFLLSSQNRVVHNLDFLPFGNISKLEQDQNLFLNPPLNGKWFALKTQYFCFGAIIFHLALLFSFLKLPEIRSVFKFSLVLSYKFLNGFFVIVFSIYNLFKKYTTRGTHVVKKILLFSNSSFHSEQSIVSFKPNLSTQTFFLNTKKRENLFFFDLNDSFRIKMSKNQVFEFFVRISPFSFTSYDQNISVKIDKQINPLDKKISLVSVNPSLFNCFVQKQNSFFSSQKKNVQKFSILKNIVHTENAEQTVASLFSFSNELSYFAFFYNSKNFRNTFYKNNKNLFFLTSASSAQKKEQIFYGKTQNSLGFTGVVHTPRYLKSIQEWDHRTQGKQKVTVLKKSQFSKGRNQLAVKNFQNMSNIESGISQFALFVLFFGKSTMQLSYSIVKGGSNISTKVFDFFEMLLFSIYKFLEKPAELMIEWIALIFLIEWSSDIATFVPDGFDISLAKSSQKFLRPLRSGSIFISFISSPFYSTFLPLNIGNSVVFFGYSNVLSFVFQKRMLYYFENLSAALTQPDMDILIRQRKGMIFWDIWAEILLKAAEKYNVNIPSFVTLKEEQELFIERLLQDKNFLINLQIEKSNSSFFILKNKKESFALAPGEMIQQNNLASFVENFIIKERSQGFPQFTLPLNKKHIHQFNLSSNTSPIFLSLLNLSFILSNLEKNAFLKSLLFNSLKNKTNNSAMHSFMHTRTQNGPLIGVHSPAERNPAERNPLGKGKERIPSFFNSFNKQQLQIPASSLYLQDQKNSFQFENVDLRACNQYATYQGPETDLFVDIHPPKSLKHIQFFKYYEPAQYTLGSFICQIYSGMFSKKVAKNILVIGAPGTAKTLFIQALAGETEMKIITDNAYRYSMVQRGVAVGMKFLRDVFDALVLQTPCFFLMEHIHVIGSKRPLLISDDENVKGVQSSFGLDQHEVHETNQMIYQFNRHSISDYKRPYKGDFSMGIPTNFFIQNFYSKIEKNSISLGASGAVFKNSQYSAGGVSLMDRNSLISPLPIDSIENSLLNQGFSEKEKTDSAFQNSFRSDNFKKSIFNFQSRLQIATQQIFAPPATSPFTILMMKEQKKLKPKKIVQETCWGGLSADQMISYQKENSSVRAKVAVLADITMNLSRGKLDMITDLLVIIDSVRSNRGFVVFGTTHLPSLLDPALRRPGRFDETISLAQSPNFLNRFEILKNNFENSLTTLDFLDSSIITENFSELNLLNLITGTKLSLFHLYKYTSPKISLYESNSTSMLVGSHGHRRHHPAGIEHVQASKQGYVPKSFDKTKIVRWQNKKLISQINPSKALQSFLKSSFFNDLYAQTTIGSSVIITTPVFTDEKFNKKQQIFDSSSQHIKSSKHFLRNFKLLKYTFLPKGPSHVLSLAYSKIGIFLAKSNLANDPTAYIPLILDTNLLSSSSSKNQQFFGNAFYGSQEQQKLQLMVFLSGKISEFFIQKTVKRSVPTQLYEKRMNMFRVTNGDNLSFVLENPFEFFDQKFSLFPSQKTKIVLTKFELNPISFDFSNIKFEKNYSNSKINRSIKKLNTLMLHKNDFFWTTFGNDQSWRSSTPFVFSIIQKRFLFTKNLLLSKMLFFDNKNQRKSPPSPPASSILMPSKKYENFKRTENDFVQKARFSINEKIQLHQQQRFLKQLYNIPVQQFFRSEMIQNRKTFFSSSFQELAYLDSLTRRSSSSIFYNKKYLGLRHRFSNFNQWWNGFLPEHNTETTYLSDVDWRTMFTTSSQKNNKQFNLSEKFNTQTFEFTMDFPDAEQYYNPRNRRWYFNAKYGKNSQNNASYWLTFDMNLQYEIYYHYLMQSFHQTFQYFDKNREIFDAFVFHLLRKGFLKELDCLATISRFKNI